MFSSCVIVALAVFQCGYCWKFAAEGEFQKHLSQDEDALISFVTPPDMTSTKFEPEWTTVQQQYPNAISVDCIRDHKLCSETGISSFPAIRLYREDGTMHRYRGPRRAKDIMAFVNRMKRPAVSELKEEHVDSFLQGEDIVFVARLAQNDESLHVRFRNLAQHHRDRYSFGLAYTSPESTSSVTCYNNVDTLRFNADDLSSVHALHTFLHRCAMPLVAQLTRRNEMNYLNAGKSLVYFFTSDDKRRDEYVSEIRPLAKSFHEYLNFVTVDSSEYPDMLAGLGLSKDASEGLALQSPKTGQAFPYGGKVTAGTVEQFIIDISEGNIQPWDGYSPMDGQGEENERHDEL